MNIDNRGFSLFELSLVLALFSVLAFKGLSHYNQLAISTESRIVLSRIRLAIELARQIALTEQQTVLVCPSDNGYLCQNSNNWSHGFIVRSLDHSQVFFRHQPLEQGQLWFDQFGQYITIHPDGRTYNAGRFTYKPKQPSLIHPRFVIVNKMARTYQIP